MSDLVPPALHTAPPDEAVPGLEIRLFGSIEVHVGPRPLPRLRSRKGLWLFALLALRGGRGVDRDWLAGTLWPEWDELDARRSLRQSLHDLRLALGPEAGRLTREAPRQLRLDVGPDSVDVLAFDAALARGDLASLQAAVQLYRGPLLEGCAEEWCLEERRRREEACVATLERLALAATARREHGVAASYLRRALAADPYREDLQRALMQAMASGGSPAEALLAYRQFRALLWQETAAEPAEETTALFRRLRDETRARPRPLTAEAPAAAATHFVGSRLSPAPSPKGSLPQPLSAFVGRESALVEIVACLSSARLVTLTGTGGIGKTRLAIRVAEECAREYADGAWFVDLAPLADAGLVPQVVARVLRLPEAPGSPLLETLREALGARQLLLVLDNCEHLIDACVHLAHALLTGCPHLRLLATSRQPLGITGEVTWRVPSLSLPNHGEGSGVKGQRSRANPVTSRPSTLDPRPSTLLQFEAVRLFVERAQAAMPGFVLTEQNVPVVLQVCRRLDGIPLAIELAAARLRALSIEQIAARLDSRFRLLTGGSREALPRQQTLQATIDWSYDLISGPERTLLRRLSVFAGGWRLEAAEAVCGDDDRPPTTDHRRPADASPGMDTPQAVVGRRSSVVAREEVLDLLTALVDKSLVLYGEEPETPPPSGARYRLLETIRQYASDRLLVSGEAEAVRDRHRDHFLQLAQQAALKLGGPEQVVWLDRLEAEHDNLRVALSGCREAEMATRMAVSLSEFWEARGYKIEGWEALRQILEQGGEIPPDLRARATRAAGLLAIRVGEYGPARVLLEESLARQRTLGDPAGIAAALHHLGILEVYAGHLRRARAYGEESLAIRRQAGDRHGSAFVLNHLGVVRIKLGDYAGARACLEESVVLMRAAGNKRGLAKVLANLGWLAQDQSDDTAARPLVEESLTLYREAGDEAGVANALRHLAGIAHRQGDAPGAAALGEESVALWRKVGERVALASTLNALGTMAREQRNAAAARSHFEEALALSRELGSQQAIVASLQNLGDLAWDAEDYGLATALFKERLRLDPKQRDPRGIAASLAGLAAVAVAEGEALRAARLLGAAEALLDTTVSPLLPAARSQYDRTATAARDVAGEAAFSTSWAEGRAMTPNQAIGYALRGVCAGLEPSTKFEREG